MEYSRIIINCHDILSKTYLEIGKLNQVIRDNHNSQRMILIHGYSSVRLLISNSIGANIEMCSAVESAYSQWLHAQTTTCIYTEKLLILDPLVHWKKVETAIKYSEIEQNDNLFDILNSITIYTDSLIKGAIFYAKMLCELPLESVSNVYAENHLAAILSNVIDMPFYPFRASIPEELDIALNYYKNGEITKWVDYFLKLIITQIQNNLLLLSKIDAYHTNLKSRISDAGVSHLKIDQFSDILMDNSFVDAKLVSQKIGIVPYRAKLALDLMSKNGILLKSDAKRNTTYILIDYYRKFLNN